MTQLSICRFCLAAIYASILFPGNIFSQKISTGRSSLSIVVTEGNHGLAPYFRNAVKDYLADQFDWNELAATSVPISGEAPTSDDAARALNKAGIGRQVMAYVWNRQPDGTFSAERLAKRGLYAATDNDWHNAKHSPRDNDELCDAGANLIGQSYVLFVQVTGFENMDQYYDRKVREAREKKRETDIKRDERGFRGDVTAWLFRLDYNEAVKSYFYSQWIYEDDSPAEKARKKQDFEITNFPMVFVREIKPDKNAFFGKGDFGGFSISATENRESGHSSDETLKHEFCEEAIEKLFERGAEEGVGNAYSLVDNRPVLAKVGRKEGAYPEKRYFVYEQVQKRNGHIKLRRRGIVRVGKRVTDNRSVTEGQTQPTRFKRVGGLGRFEPGMALKAKPEIGLALQGVYPITTYENRKVAGGLGVELNLSLWLGQVFGTNIPTGLRLGGNLLFDYQKNGSEKEDKRNFTRWSAHLRKEIPVASIFYLSPSVGYASESMRTMEESGKTLSSVIIPFGFEAGLNLAPAIKVFGQAEYATPYGNVKFKTSDDDEKKDYLVNGSAVKWFDLFPERPQTMLRAGLRLSF